MSTKKHAGFPSNNFINRLAVAIDNKDITKVKTMLQALQEMHRLGYFPINDCSWLKINMIIDDSILQTDREIFKELYRFRVKNVHLNYYASIPKGTHDGILMRCIVSMDMDMLKFLIDEMKFDVNDIGFSDAIKILHSKDLKIFKFMFKRFMLAYQKLGEYRVESFLKRLKKEKNNDLNSKAGEEAKKIWQYQIAYADVFYIIAKISDNISILSLYSNLKILDTNREIAATLLLKFFQEIISVDKLNLKNLLNSEKLIFFNALLQGLYYQSCSRSQDRESWQDSLFGDLLNSYLTILRLFKDLNGETKEYRLAKVFLESTQVVETMDAAPMQAVPDNSLPIQQPLAQPKEKENSSQEIDSPMVLTELVKIYLESKEGNLAYHNYKKVISSIDSENLVSIWELFVQTPGFPLKAIYEWLEQAKNHTNLLLLDEIKNLIKLQPHIADDPVFLEILAKLFGDRVQFYLEIPEFRSYMNTNYDKNKLSALLNNTIQEYLTAFKKDDFLKLFMLKELIKSQLPESDLACEVAAVLFETYNNSAEAMAILMLAVQNKNITVGRAVNISKKYLDNREVFNALPNFFRSLLLQDNDKQINDYLIRQLAAMYDEKIIESLKPEYKNKIRSIAVMLNHLNDWKNEAQEYHFSMIDNPLIGQPKLNSPFFGSGKQESNNISLKHMKEIINFANQLMDYIANPDIETVQISFSVPDGDKKQVTVKDLDDFVTLANKYLELNVAAENYFLKNINTILTKFLSSYSGDNTTSLKNLDSIGRFGRFK